LRGNQSGTWTSDLEQRVNILALRPDASSIAGYSRQNGKILTGDNGIPYRANGLFRMDQRG
jgi:hypothetical protein